MLNIVNRRLYRNNKLARQCAAPYSSVIHILDTDPLSLYNQNKPEQIYENEYPYQQSLQTNKD